MGFHALLQGIFPTQGSNPGSPALQMVSLPSEPSGTPTLTLLPFIFPDPIFLVSSWLHLSTLHIQCLLQNNRDNSNMGKPICTGLRMGCTSTEICSRHLNLVTVTRTVKLSCACVLSPSDSATPWTVAARFFCSWAYPGKNTRVGCHALFQGMFATQGWDPHLLWLLPCVLSPGCHGWSRAGVIPRCIWSHGEEATGEGPVHNPRGRTQLATMS